MEYGTIKIPQDDYERHNDRRRDLGLTWAEYIDGQAPETPTAACKFPDDFENLADAVATIEERTGRIERTLEDLGAGR